MSKLDSSLGLQDTMPFGKNKGKTIEAIYKENVGYLLWLRDERKKENGDEKLFAFEVLVLLDDAIRNSKSLAAKHKSWGATLLPQGPVTAPVAAPADQEIEFAYAGAWGAF